MNNNEWRLKFDNQNYGGKQETVVPEIKGAMNYGNREVFSSIKEDLKKVLHCTIICHDRIVSFNTGLPLISSTLANVYKPSINTSFSCVIYTYIYYRGYTCIRFMFHIQWYLQLLCVLVCHLQCNLQLHYVLMCHVHWYLHITLHITDVFLWYALML